MIIIRGMVQKKKWKISILIPSSFLENLLKSIISMIITAETQTELQCIWAQMNHFPESGYIQAGEGSWARIGGGLTNGNAPLGYTKPLRFYGPAPESTKLEKINQEKQVAGPDGNCGQSKSEESKPRIR